MLHALLHMRTFPKYTRCNVKTSKIKIREKCNAVTMYVYIPGKAYAGYTLRNTSCPLRHFM